MFRSVVAPDVISGYLNVHFQTVTSLRHLGPPTGKLDFYSFKKKIPGVPLIFKLIKLKQNLNITVVD